MKTDKYSIKGNLVDPINRSIKGVILNIEKGIIKSISKTDSLGGPFILPGFIDSHIHIESSMLIPSRFAEMAVVHGTIAVVTDPHEVANVAGVEGIRFMQNNAKKVPMKFFFGVPSCVPASPLEKSGAILDSTIVSKLILDNDFYFLAEMMNFPGVVNDDPDVVAKLSAAHKAKKPIDGHVPGLSGEMLGKYTKAGITTDHECSTQQEAIEKIKLCMKILIREGSAAKNFENLVPLLKEYPKEIMFCTDDCHPDYLKNGHINSIVARTIAKGYDLFDTLYAACISPIDHYNLPLGKLRIGDKADFILVNNLTDFKVLETHIDGNKVFANQKVAFDLPSENTPDFTFRSKHQKGDLKIISLAPKLNIIEAIDGELLTNRLIIDSPVPKGEIVVVDLERDLLKIVLLDRYTDTPPQVAFINGFGLKQGAIAASIAHDSHHIVAVGCDDVSIDNALQWIVEKRGGLCYFYHANGDGIELPFFGLMTNEQGVHVSEKYESLNKKVQQAGCVLKSPFMTASFMALTVIPHIKINHNGLFDSLNFKSIPLFQ